MKTVRKTPEEIALDPEKVGKLLEQAKGIAREYRSITGRPLGITGEVAGYEAARLLHLSLCKKRQADFDATGPDGKRYQIKGRVVYQRAKPEKSFGRIRLDHEWDAVLLVLLEADFSPMEIYEAERAEVEKALMEPGARARNQRGALNIAKFKAIARLAWSREAKIVSPPQSQTTTPPPQTTLKVRGQAGARRTRPQKTLKVRGQAGAGRTPRKA